MSTVWANTENEADRKTFRGLGLELQSQRFYGDAAAIKISGEISSENFQLLNHYSGPVVFDFTLPSAQYSDEKT